MPTAGAGIVEVMTATTTREHAPAWPGGDEPVQWVMSTYAAPEPLPRDRDVREAPPSPSANRREALVALLILLAIAIWVLRGGLLQLGTLGGFLQSLAQLTLWTAALLAPVLVVTRLRGR